jgi:hypothetical protein
VGTIHLSSRPIIDIMVAYLLLIIFLMRDDVPVIPAVMNLKMSQFNFFMCS